MLHEFVCIFDMFTLVRFETEALERQLVSKIEAKVCRLGSDGRNI